jgi:hypothetical protein
LDRVFTIASSKRLRKLEVEKESVRESSESSERTAAR